MELDLGEMGPIDFLVVEFPGGRVISEAMRMILDLHDQGIIRVLDLRFVRKEQDGSVTGLRVADLDQDGTLDLAVFASAVSGLVGQDEVDEASAVIQPGNSAGIFVYENTWAAPLTAALRRSGAQFVASGRIPIPAMGAKLDDKRSKD